MSSAWIAILLLVLCVVSSRVVCSLVTRPCSELEKFLSFLIGTCITTVLLIKLAESTSWGDHLNWILAPVLILALPILSMKRWMQSELMLD